MEVGGPRARPACEDHLGELSRIGRPLLWQSEHLLRAEGARPQEGPWGQAGVVRTCGASRRRGDHQGCHSRVEWVAPRVQAHRSRADGRQGQHLAAFQGCFRRCVCASWCLPADAAAGVERQPGSQDGDRRWGADFYGVSVGPHQGVESEDQGDPGVAAPVGRSGGTAARESEGS